MATNTAIYNFASKWLDVFLNPKTNMYELKNSSFIDECFSLGFELFLGIEYLEADKMEELRTYYFDQMRLGSCIFTRWNFYVNSSLNSGFLAARIREYLIVALNRLKALSFELGNNLNIYQGEANELQLISNKNLSANPQPDDEVSQHLTIATNGKVTFTSYSYGDGFTYQKKRSKKFKIKEETASYLINSVNSYFGEEQKAILGQDLGNWYITLTNQQNEKYFFYGALEYDLIGELDDCSELIRQQLKMLELLVFDGYAKEDIINKIVIDYHHVSKIESNELPEDVTLNYSEQLLIDRKTETLLHTQNITSECQVTRKYHIIGGISLLLDALYSKTLFANVIGNGPDVMVNPLQTSDYKITIDYEIAKRKELSGSFDKNGLPEDFPEFMTRIYHFIETYGLGIIFNQNVYNHKLRKKTDYIFCKVQFYSEGKAYCYLTEDDSLKVGDRVVVPVSQDNHESIATISSIEYYSKDEAPYPLAKTKSIIRKAKDGEVIESKVDDTECDPLWNGDEVENLWKSFFAREWSDKLLAMTLANTWNKCRDMYLDLDDDCCTPEEEAECDKWFKLEKILISEVARREEQVITSDDVKLITPFMQRNGYQESGLRWIKEREE